MNQDEEIALDKRNKELENENAKLKKEIEDCTLDIIRINIKKQVIETMLEILNNLKK